MDKEEENNHIQKEKGFFEWLNIVGSASSIVALLMVVQNEWNTWHFISLILSIFLSVCIIAAICTFLFGYIDKWYERQGKWFKMSLKGGLFLAGSMAFFGIFMLLYTLIFYIVGELGSLFWETVING